ncbi:MAG: hypothetical protein RJA57_351 [Bacteroidota bacterium]
MKKESLVQIYFSNREAAKNTTESPRSPYLKAVLSNKLREAVEVVQTAISDQLAAVRYIKNSQRNHRLRCG